MGKNQRSLNNSREKTFKVRLNPIIDHANEQINGYSGESMQIFNLELSLNSGPNFRNFFENNISQSNVRNTPRFNRCIQRKITNYGIGGATFNNCKDNMLENPPDFDITFGKRFFGNK